MGSAVYQRVCRELCVFLSFFFFLLLPSSWRLSMLISCLVLLRKGFVYLSELSAVLWVIKKAASKKTDFIWGVGNDLLLWAWHLGGSASWANKFHPEVNDMHSVQGAICSPDHSSKQKNNKAVQKCCGSSCLFCLGTSVYKQGKESAYLILIRSIPQKDKLIKGSLLIYYIQGSACENLLHSGKVPS